MKGTPITAGTILIHTIFSTKDQQPLIVPELEPILYDKISKILFDECYSPALKIGGYVEHLHIFYVNARDRSPDFIINRVKEKSAQFVHKWYPEFEWQEGYAAVTISRTDDEFVKDLIARQKEFHQTVAYKDEFRQFLDENGIEYDEKELWD